MGNTQAYAKEFTGAARQPCAGVSIQTLDSGDGQTFPMAGQRARVAYQGVDRMGKKFAGQGFFPVGMNAADKCLDKGVAAMSVGERALLTCTPDTWHQSVADMYERQGLADGRTQMEVKLIGIKSCNGVDGC